MSDRLMRKFNCTQDNSKLFSEIKLLISEIQWTSRGLRDQHQNALKIDRENYEERRWFS